MTFAFFCCVLVHELCIWNRCIAPAAALATLSAASVLVSSVNALNTVHQWRCGT
jgi:hypothetical protein